MPAKTCGEKVGFRWGATIYCHNKTRHPSKKCHLHRKDNFMANKEGKMQKLVDEFIDFRSRAEVTDPAAQTQINKLFDMIVLLAKGTEQNMSDIGDLRRSSMQIGTEKIG